MKKTFTLAAIGLLAAILLSAGALLIGRYDQPKDDDSAVERLSAPVSQIGSGSAQQTPNVQPEEKSPTAEPLGPPTEAPQTSLQPKEQSPAVEPQDPPAEAPLTSLDSTREVKVDFRRFGQLIPRDAINPIYRPRFIPAESAALNPVFMRAMTWWDHETESVWSQPWGMAIGGPLEGTRLSLIPAGMVPWAAWHDEHPETLVLDVPGYGSRRFSSDFVIGIALGESAKAYPFEMAREAAVVNDTIGNLPVVVLVDAETKAIHSFLRNTEDGDLEFTLQDGKLVDLQTGSHWDGNRGLAIDGPLKGEVLQQVPYITSFNWAWEDIYPHTEFFRGVGPS